jgi:hypothetical protein
MAPLTRQQTRNAQTTRGAIIPQKKRKTNRRKARATTWVSGLKPCNFDFPAGLFVESRSKSRGERNPEALLLGSNGQWLYALLSKDLRAEAVIRPAYYPIPRRHKARLKRKLLRCCRRKLAGVSKPVPASQLILHMHAEETQYSRDLRLPSQSSVFDETLT